MFDSQLDLAPIFHAIIIEMLAATKISGCCHSSLIIWAVICGCLQNIFHVWRAQFMIFLVFLMMNLFYVSSPSLSLIAQHPILTIIECVLDVND